MTGEVLVLKTEIHNEHDRFAVAIIKDGEVIRHVPCVLKVMGYCLLISNLIKIDLFQHWCDV